MGRKKRAVHPWSSHDHALAACVQALGTDAAQEGIEAFKLASENSSGGGPNGDTYIPWVSDLLYLVERKYDVRVTGGLATLLWIASGARPLSSEDRFELSRKTWDEAIRRARRRERIGWPFESDETVRDAHRMLVWAESLYRPRASRSADELRAQLRSALDGLARAADELSERRLHSLVGKLLQLHLEIRNQRRS